MNLKLIFSTILVLVIISCSILNSDSNRIEGEWEWIQSTGGFAGHTISPDSAGYSERRISFTSANRFSYYRADTLVLSGHYLLKKNDKDVVISYKTKNDRFIPDQYVVFKSSDTLILNDRCLDCYTNVYKRKK